MSRFRFAVRAFPRLAILACALALVSACKRPSAQGMIGERGGAVAPASSPSPSTSAPPPLAPKQRAITDVPGAAPNLFDLVPARVAVSSAVENPHDFPEFLVDGKADTAWNGKTGDLVGATISFRLPLDVRVKRIEMTAGYDRKSGGVDYFTANHRITSVELSRDGVVLGTYPLDPKTRGAQAIPVTGPGGDYQIKVLATLPGTNRKWNELAVSELRVVGDPGVERRDPAEAVRVVVGTLDQMPDRMADDVPTAIAEVYPSIGAFCARQLADVAADRAQLLQTARENNLPLLGGSCATLRELPLEGKGVGATYRRGFVVGTSNGIATSEQVVVEMARGVVPTGARWSTADPLDPGCPSDVQIDGVRAVRVENGHLVVVLAGRRQWLNPDGTWKTIFLTDVTWCKEGPKALSCRTYGAGYRPLLQSFAISPTGELVRQRAEKNPFDE